MDKKELKQLPKRHKLDNPDMVNTDNASLFDMHEDMKTVDAIPVEELNDQLETEKDMISTKHTPDDQKRFR